MKQRRRYGSRFHQCLRQARERFQWSDEEIVAYRDAEVQAFVGYAESKVPYYRQLFREHGIDVKQIKQLSDLAQIPILTKEILQARIADFVPEENGDLRRSSVTTSGTTGTGLIFEVDESFQAEQWATWWRYREWHGLGRSDWCGYFGGRLIVPAKQKNAPFHRVCYPSKQVFLSAFHLSEESAADYVACLNKYQFDWWHGYPSFLASLAGYVLDLGLKIVRMPQVITIGSESLQGFQRDLMQRAFDCDPRQHYGMAEGVANFSQRQDGSLVVDEDFAAVEFLPTESDGLYRVIGTGFRNYAFPLIRYDVGDLVAIDSGQVNRNGWRVVEDVYGRKDDYLVLEDGTRLGRLGGILRGNLGVREAQIRQSEPGHFTLEVVPSSNWSEECLQTLSNAIDTRVGKKCTYQIKLVASIERTGRGKFRFVVSTI